MGDFDHLREMDKPGRWWSDDQLVDRDRQVAEKSLLDAADSLDGVPRSTSTCALMRNGHHRIPVKESPMREALIEELAEELYLGNPFVSGPKDQPSVVTPWSCDLPNYDYFIRRATEQADAVLASDWLAEHDREVADRAWREATDDYELYSVIPGEERLAERYARSPYVGWLCPAHASKDRSTP